METLATEELGSLIERGETGNRPFQNTLAIIGGGTMGQGLAQLAAQKGMEVILIEKDSESMGRSLKDIEESLDREIERWALTPSEKKAILSRIKGDWELNKVVDINVVVEAIPENADMKKDLLKRLEGICTDECIFITTTSTLSITELASTLARPERVIGMHFITPVTKVKVVELVRGLKTCQETFQKALNLARRLERTPIEVFEAPGYVTTRVMVPLINEAIQVLMEGVASAEDIDLAMKLGYEMVYGPLEMADRMGLDTLLSWMEILFRDLGDPKYRPAALLRMLVRAGHLGTKTGEGFFKYDDEGKLIPGSGHTVSTFQRFMG